jgi:hypothetical protein
MSRTHPLTIFAGADGCLFDEFVVIVCPTPDNLNHRQIRQRCIITHDDPSLIKTFENIVRETIEDTPLWDTDRGHAFRDRVTYRIIWKLERRGIAFCIRRP